MKVVHINTFPNGSTGSIMMNIHNELLKQGHDSYVVWGRGRGSKNEHEIYLNDKIGVYFHVFYARLTGKVGFASKKSTKRLLKILDEIKPDIIHLHNLHGYYINIQFLFDYIKANDIKIIWTLHDCWSFTGHCAYFDMCGCNKWKLSCNKCPQIKTYPKSLLDSSNWCFNKKKELFSNVSNLTIVTPSEWLSNLVKLSYLKQYSVKIINNGIDMTIFKKIDESKLNFRRKYDLGNKIIILGVANEWTERKGLKDFIELSKVINDTYKIVLVGLSKKQINNIPSKILGLERTKNIDELVDIYNSADVFYNPTYEDNYPTTNIEAHCCGLPVVTYNSGGSCETLNHQCVVTDLQTVLETYDTIFKTSYNKIEKDFSKQSNCLKYIDLYKELIKK